MTCKKLIIIALVIQLVSCFYYLLVVPLFILPFEQLKPNNLELIY